MWIKSVSFIQKLITQMQHYVSVFFYLLQLYEESQDSVWLSTFQTPTEDCCEKKYTHSESHSCRIAALTKDQKEATNPVGVVGSSQFHGLCALEGYQVWSCSLEDYSKTSPFPGVFSVIVHVITNKAHEYHYHFQRQSSSNKTSVKTIWILI